MQTALMDEMGFSKMGWYIWFSVTVVVNTVDLWNWKKNNSLDLKDFTEILQISIHTHERK